ncbi:hypothetical protein JKG47_14800 [Acidithiobacillus sp. MC6.1]|nr:hypothetical protein [Acidithiobacillus sp. MC6.1]
MTNADDQQAPAPKKRMTAAKVGRGALWAVGLAPMLGVTRTIADPIKEIATDTRDGMRRSTPSLKEARAAWNRDTPEDPADRFAVMARRAHLSEAGRLEMVRYYTILLVFMLLGVAGGGAVMFWNLSGLLLVALAGVASMAVAYRRDAVIHQRMPTFSRWIKERMWWIFG